VSAVDVGVSHHDNLLVAQVVDIELVADTRPERRDEIAYLVVLQNPVQAVFLDVQDLPFIGRIA